MTTLHELEERQEKLAKAVKVNDAKKRAAEQLKISAVLEAYNFDKSKLQTITLDDGSKAYRDGSKMLIVENDGFFMAEKNGDKVRVCEVKFDEKNKISTVEIPFDKDVLRLQNKLEKFCEADVSFDYSNTAEKFSTALFDTYFAACRKTDEQKHAETSQPQLTLNTEKGR